MLDPTNAFVQESRSKGKENRKESRKKMLENILRFLKNIFATRFILEMGKIGTDGNRCSYIIHLCCAQKGKSEIENVKMDGENRTNQRHLTAAIMLNGRSDTKNEKKNPQSNRSHSKQTKIHNKWSRRHKIVEMAKSFHQFFFASSHSVGLLLTSRVHLHIVLFRLFLRCDATKICLFRFRSYTVYACPAIGLAVSSHFTMLWFHFFLQRTSFFVHWEIILTERGILIWSHVCINRKRFIP